MKKFKKLTAAAIVCTMFVTLQAANATMDTGLGGGLGGAVINGTQGGFTGMNTGNNSATLNFNGSALVNWNTLNLNSNETLNFNATSGSNATILNTVNNGMSQLYGSINANEGVGKLIISNPNGMLFDGAHFSTAGDVMLTTQGMSATFNGNDMTLNYDTAEHAGASVTIRNNSNFNVGGEFNITAPTIELANSAFTAGNSMKLITADGQNYLTSPTTSADNRHFAVKMDAVDINGDVYITSGKDLVNIYRGGTINGDLNINADGSTVIGARIKAGADGRAEYDSQGNITLYNSSTLRQDIKGDLNSTVDGRLSIIRNTDVDGNLNASNSGGYLEIKNVNVDGNANLRTTVATNTGVKHFIHVVGNNNIGGDMNIDSAHNIHIGGYDKTLHNMLDGKLNVGGDLTANAREGSLTITVDTDAKNVDLKAGLNILSDGQAVVNADTYKLEARHYIGGIADDQSLIGIMENYIPVDRTTVRTYRLNGESTNRVLDNRTLPHTYFQIGSGEVKMAKVSTPTGDAEHHIHLRSNGNMLVTGLEAQTAELSAAGNMKITGPNVHADLIKVDGETDRLTVDTPANARDYVLKYRNIKDDAEITINPDTEITYDMANGDPNGWNHGTQQDHNTYLVVEGGNGDDPNPPGPNPPGPNPPGPNPPGPNPPKPDPVVPNPTDPTLNYVRPEYTTTAINDTGVSTPIAFAADIDEEIENGVRKNVDGSVTVVKTFSKTKGDGKIVK